MEKFLISFARLGISSESAVRCFGSTCWRKSD
jgi:hypothetical protein